MKPLVTQKTAVNSGTFLAAIRAEEPDSFRWPRIMAQRMPYTPGPGPSENRSQNHGQASPEGDAGHEDAAADDHYCRRAGLRPADRAESDRRPSPPRGRSRSPCL